MVSKKILFVCDICGQKHDTLKDAQTCERRGRPKLYPIGMIFGLPYYENIIFAIIKQEPDMYPHHHSYNTWACRDTCIQDNCTGNNFCGLDSWTEIIKPDIKLPAYKRMMIALEKAQIKPIDYQG